MSWKRSPRLPVGKEEPKRHTRKKPEIKGVKLTAGRAVGIRRRELAMTQFDLACEIGISRNEVGRIERDEVTCPELETIDALESILGIQLFDRFMEQQREKIKQGEETSAGVVINDFRREIARRGIGREQLKSVLDEALKNMESGPGEKDYP